VLLGEGALRALAPRPDLMSEWALALDGVLDEEIIFLGPLFRSDEHYQRQEGLRDVVLLGDSFTQGYPVAPEAAYPSVLRARLSERGMPVNLIAIGMGDSGPDQQLRVFERELLGRLTPDVVVWQFYPNDEFDNVVKAVYGIREGALVPLDATRNWLYRRQQLYARIPLREALRHRSYLFRYAMKSAERVRAHAVPRRYPGGAPRWGLDKLRLEIERMKALGRERGFLTYFVLVAPEVLYLDPAERSADSTAFLLAPYERMSELLRGQPGFIEARFDDPGSGLPAAHLFVGGDRDRNARGGRHFNETGYRLLADRVLSRLVADGAVGVAPRGAPR
jgi:lysophospholipase L1-like esterase